MSASDTVATTWSRPPDWVLALAEECDRTSQRRAAGRVGYSPATISMVLRRAYGGDIRAVERAVRDTLMRATVVCPVAGEISGTACGANQAAPYRAANPMRVALYRACRSGCVHAREGGR